MAGHPQREAGTPVDDGEAGRHHPRHRRHREHARDYDDRPRLRQAVQSPFSNWTWYITELDRETGQCFGLVEGLERELGYFDLTELAETTVCGGVPAVERDLYWQPIDPGRDQERGSRGDPFATQ